MTSPHTVLLASAGTGKTWQLATHYLKLVMAGVEPERILATTFTRKAAGEILGRVLERLADAALSDSEAATLGTQIDIDGLTAARCKARLVQLARSLQNFRIQTLDAWFAHIARLFANELGLPPDWRIADPDEERRVRSDALVESLADGQDEEWLVLLRALAKGDGDLRVHEALLDHVRTGSYVVDGIPDAAWDVPAVTPDLDDGVFAEALDALRAAEMPKTAKGEENKNWVKAREKLATTAESGDWEGLFQDGFLTKGLAGDSYYQKPFEDDLLEIFRVLLRRARHHVLANVRSRNAALRDLLTRFQEVYAEHQWDSRTLRFDDVGIALARGSEGNLKLEPLELAFRLDAQIGHLLLDEFQDTAPLQWTVLAPLVESITSEGDAERTFFCVGDEKQSIYGFRGGEPRLLTELERALNFNSPPLDMSRRSSPVVLGTVNQLFQRIDRLPLLNDSPPLLLAAEEFQQRYRDHEAFDVDSPGAAYLWQAPAPGDGDADDDEDAKLERAEDLALRFAVERVVAIHAEAPHARIGVLFRRNKFLNEFVRALEQKGIPASSEGGSSLTDAAPVLAVLAALHWIDHPADSAAAHHVATSCLAGPIGIEPGAPEETSEALARGLRRRYSEEGPGALLASWAPAVQATGDAFGLMRFEQVVDLAYESAPHVAGRPTALVRRIRDAKHEDVRPGSVRAMTVHKSKGLEFDAVVLPELSDLLLRKSPALLVDRPEPTQQVTAVSTSVAKEILEHCDELARLDLETRRREAVDDLCILYVALTRARHRIDMIVSSKLPKRSYGRILLEAFETGEADEDGLLWKHADSQSEWMPPATAPSAPIEAEPVPEPELRMHAGEGTRSPRRRTASGSKAARKRLGVDLLQRYGQDARRRGTLVHRLMAQVEWLEDFDLADEVLLTHLRDEDPDASSEAQAEALALFRETLQMPGIQELLSLGDRDPASHEVRNERNFHESVAGDDGVALWTGAMDRVVVRRKDGRFVSAEIVDHKTDDPAGGLEPLIDQYRPQMEGYRAVLAHQLELDPECIRLRLAFLRVGEVRDV